MPKLIVFFIGCVLFCFIPAHNAHAAPFSVCTLAELTSAITTANSNSEADIINFNCSTTLNFTSEFTILDDGAGNGITINSNGNTVIFDGGNSTRLFRVNMGASLELNGFTLQNGNGAPGGAIYNSGTATINNSTFTGNSSNGGGAIANGNTTIINNSVFTGNSATFAGAIISTSSITINNSAFIGNSASSAGGALIINGGTATINASTFQDNIAPWASGVRNDGITSSTNSYYENNVCQGFGIADNGGNTVVNALGCPGTAPVLPLAPIMITAPVLGCALDTTDGLEIANTPDNTYCRVLMKDGVVIGYSGAIPAELIALGVIFAVDVYRLEGGTSLTSFPNYARVCLSGQGRLFYMDSRNAPRVAIELQSENGDGLTCGWIPAPGTLILTN